MILVNGSPISFTLFPDNTSQVWKVKQLDISGTNWVNVTWKFEHEGEFMQLAQLKMLVDKMGFEAALNLPFLPYGRQDKEIHNNTTFALNTFAKLLNSLYFQEVIINDPHSSIALNLINNSRAKYPVEKVKKSFELTKSELVCYPDKGALYKYNEKVYNYPYLFGIKHRDQLTGYITGYEITSYQGHSCKNKNILIIDDICDGGATFTLLASKLIKAGAREVNLFVTHGIFSKGLKVLKDSGINRIFTHDGEASEVQQQITYRRL